MGSSVSDNLAQYYEQKIKKIEKTTTPLLIFDLRVMVYILLDHYNSIAEYQDKETRDTWLKASWSLAFNRGFTGYKYIPHTLLIVDDSAPYWRSNYLRERGFPEYKGDRPSKPDNWFIVYNFALEYINHPKCPYHYISIPTYEADDLASAIVRLTKIYNNRDCHLYTIDSDWQGLVEAETSETETIENILEPETPPEKRKVVWMNMNYWTPRIRTNKEVKEHTKKRLKSNIDTPREIWDIKSIKGDPSDNLISGSPLEVIDLVKPPKEYDILNNLNHVSTLDKAIFDYKQTTNFKHLTNAEKWFLKNGYTIPLVEYNKFSLNF
jgi:hypothetical protein